MAFSPVKLDTTCTKYVSVCDLCRYLPAAVADSSSVHGACNYALEHVLGLPACKQADSPALSLVPHLGLLAKAHHGVAVNAVDADPLQLCQALCLGNPVLCTVAFFPDYYGPNVASNGTVNMRSVNESTLTEEAICLTGFDESEKLFYARNPLVDDSWGHDGYFTVPYEYILSYGREFHIIRAAAPAAEAPVSLPEPVVELPAVPVNSPAPELEAPVSLPEPAGPSPKEVLLNENNRSNIMATIKNNILTVFGNSGVAGIEVIMFNLNQFINAWLNDML